MSNGTSVSLYIALASLIVTIFGTIASFYYTRRSVKRKSLVEESIKEVGNLIQSINHWTDPIFFTFRELEIATNNIIRNMHDEKIDSILLKINPYLIEMYSRDLNNIRKEPSHYTFDSKNNVHEFLLAFRSGEPVGTQLHCQSEPRFIPNTISLKCVWSLHNLELSIKKLFKYSDLIEPIDPKIIGNLASVVPNLISAFLNSLESQFSEIEINSSMSSKEIYEILYKNIFNWQYIDYTLGWLQGDFIERLRKVQKNLFIKS